MSGKGRGASFVAPVLAALGGNGRVEHALTQGAGGRRSGSRRRRWAGASGGSSPWGATAPGATSRTGSCAPAFPPKLGLVPGGTGCDLAKSLGIPPRDVPACARIILEGHSRAIDVGRIEDKHFLNVVGFGYDVAVIEDSWTVGWLQGRASLSLLRPAAAPHVPRIRGGPRGGRGDAGKAGSAHADPGQRPDLRGRLPHRSPGRARRRACSKAPRSATWAFSRAWASCVRLLLGTHEGAREVLPARASRFRLRFDSPPAYETDGEWNRAKTADLTVETRPGALDVLVPGP